ncbi:MAG: VOC family protein [Thermoguttaceae bacterium]
MTELSHTIVFARDMARSVAFYRDLLGLPVRFESAKWTEFETPATTLALHLADVSASDGMTVSADAIPAGMCHLSFAVDDLDAFHEKMTANGVRCLQPPKEEDFGGRLAGYADPDGLPFWVGGKADKS